MDIQSLKRRAAAAIDAYAAPVEAYLRDIEAHPELGFEEFYTARRMQGFLEELGLSPRGGLAVTGVEAVLDSGREGPTIAMMGELDAIFCLGATHTDPETGAAHQCGHHVQQAVMLAVAAGLTRSGVMGALSGRVKFLGTPAEEAGVFNAARLRREGKIHLPTGKAELIRQGVFDDVDMAMQMHCWSHAPGPLCLCVVRNLGMLGITARYRGKQAHAASEAYNGVNALYAATTGIGMVHLLRESFNEADHPRVHCVLAEGGANPNSIPDFARVECCVKANNVPALEALLRRVTGALRAGARALGAELELEVRPGMLPMRTDETLSRMYMENAAGLMPADCIGVQEQQFACSDLGDVAQLMPVLYPQAGGVDGAGHAADFRVVDFNSAVLLPAKTFASTICDLLYGGAEAARAVAAAHMPAMSKREYLDTMERYFSANA